MFSFSFYVLYLTSKFQPKERFSRSDKGSFISVRRSGYTRIYKDQRRPGFCRNFFKKWISECSKSRLSYRTSYGQRGTWQEASPLLTSFCFLLFPFVVSPASQMWEQQVWTFYYNTRTYVRQQVSKHQFHSFSTVICRHARTTYRAILVHSICSNSKSISGRLYANYNRQMSWLLVRT